MAKRKDADLAAWFYSDDKNEVERKVKAGGSGGGENTAWIIDTSPAFHCEHLEYRKRERKFNEGEWYPVINHYGERHVMVYRDGLKIFGPTLDGDDGYPRSEFAFVGEPLGKVDFGV